MEIQENLPTATVPPAVQLKKLSPKHKEVLSLVAQGVDRVTIANATGFVPEYVTWLVRQDVCKEYLADMKALADFQLETMTQDSVDAIRDTLHNGTGEDRLKAARLQMEAVGRIGSRRAEATDGKGDEGRLEKLAERLVGLLKDKRERVIDVEVVQVAGE